jgi:hypothetical protein
MGASPPTDAAARLHQARWAAIDGRHEEALREYIWFHNHALRHEPSLYGVRLSFALSYWMELAKAYPKARRELERIRAGKIAALRNGKGGRDLFHDVTAINRQLTRPRDTYRLFRKLQATRPRLASRCATIALPAIVLSRDFELARHYLPWPARRVARLAERLNGDIAGLKHRNSRAPARQAYIHNYCEDVRMLIAVLRGVGERSLAAEIRTSALDLVHSRSVRQAVRAALTK